MISAQIDELRELAGDGSMEWVAGPVRASVLREAADTIWQLRDDLQRANEAIRDAEHDESRAWDRVRKVEAENAKLREWADAPKCETCEAMLDCDECLRADGSHKERRWLAAENAKLRDGAYAMRQLYEDKLKHALEENSKLREQLAKARDPQRVGCTADPESFVYAIEQLREFRWQHATNDEEAIPYINNVADAHERENAKLLELLQRTWDAFHDATARKFVRVKNELRELGVEVDG